MGKLFEGIEPRLRISRVFEAIRECLEAIPIRLPRRSVLRHPLFQHLVQGFREYYLIPVPTARYFQRAPPLFVFHTQTPYPTESTAIVHPVTTSSIVPFKEGGRPAHHFQHLAGNLAPRPTPLRPPVINSAKSSPTNFDPQLPQRIGYTIP